MKKEKWFVSNKKADFQEIAEEFGISLLLARLIRNRDIKKEEISSFLKGTIEDLYSPVQMKDMEKGILILKNKILQKKKIRVVPDYDVDGCCSGTILIKAIERCGGIVDYDIPDRQKDGYGINERIVEDAWKENIDTILTCDNGISALSAVDAAKEKGMTVIITDHHEVPFEEKEGKRIYVVPKADAIINPKQLEDTYPFKSLCGAGVAYKLVQALYQSFGIPEKEAEPFIQIAAIATICDIVDLKGENRILVKQGLEQIHKTKYPGIRSLIQMNHLDCENLSYYHIGFVLGPCINASGRLETAQKAIQLLMAEEQEKADQLAIQLKMLNDSRKEMTVQAVQKAIEIIEESGMQEDPILVVFVNCHESVAGIVAGRIREKYYRPVIIMTDTEGEGMIKGSGRSIEEYNLFEGILACKELLIKFGGHPMAAGLSLEKKNLEAFREKIKMQCHLQEDSFVEKVIADAVFPIGNLSEKVIQEMECLEPFGKANKKPLFAEKEVEILYASVLGKNKNVLKMKVKNNQKCVMDALYFGDIEEFLAYIGQKFGKEDMEKLFQGQGGNVILDVIYYPRINEFNGRKSIQIVIQHYR